MPKLKLRHPQVHVGADVMQQRLDLCRWYLALTQTMYEMTFPDHRGGFGSNMELMLVLIGVFIGDAEGRPTTATKIAGHCGLSRATVYRRLDQLITMRKITREGRNYFIAPGVAPADEQGLLSRVLEKFPSNARPNRTH
jgi:hypothetical protein